MITEHRAGSGRSYALHKVSDNVIRLSHVPRERRPKRAEAVLDAALRIRMMQIGRETSATPDETHLPHLCA
jgi:hypothetical protein